MEREEIIDMAWTEKNFNSDFDKIKQCLETEFKKIYSTNAEQRFVLPNGSAMKIVLLNFKAYHSFVMDYKSDTDWDDGDQYFPSDYNSFEELFQAMLEETQR